ncbi:PREDICTED: leucine-rich repeat-containing protein 15-like [Branchiostoma belcheri]|uniref:Leucine-rich repeat-containing protein 15-like n=1 Tax=Branchiostoma belcheri TaxID=7741 RepID=A0A6P4YHE3_BRABE|nr:PREDICTED: leucine-rich repeat-containing protein 15-like [Branchiostoma belcheri]
MPNKLKKLLVLLVIILHETGSTTPCSQSCYPSCVCSRNLGLTSVPEDLSKSLTYLDLSGNDIATISRKTLLRYRRLEKLVLSSNQIIDIQSGSFPVLPQLLELSLNSNKITNIQRGAFSNIPRLQKLFLSSNRITNIQHGVFTSLAQLQELSLSSNQITNIQRGAFKNLPQLQKLFLSSNRITNIQRGTFLNLPQLQKLFLSSNRITFIQHGAFRNLAQLQELSLSQNQIQHVEISNLPQLQNLNLARNQITNIRHGVFRNLPQLQNLNLKNNQISNIQLSAFSNLLQLQSLYLNGNRIKTIQSDALSNLPQLQTLQLHSNQMETLSSTAYSMLSSISSVTMQWNPWQCDCRMLPFRLQMNGSHSFENHMTCSKPDNLQGQKLKDINPEDFCKEPTIRSFHRVDNDTLVQGETLHLVCEASGMPKPDVTVTFPSGLNTTVESGGRVTVEVKNTTATVTITGVTAADAGQYTCIATNPAGSASATLSVNVHLKVPTTTAKLNAPPLTDTLTHPMVTSNSNLASSATFSPPVPVGSTPSEHLLSSPSSSLPGSTPGPSQHLVSSKTSSLSINTSSTPSDQTESDPTFSD